MTTIPNPAPVTTTAEDAQEVAAVRAPVAVATSDAERAAFEAWVKTGVGHPHAGILELLMWAAWQASAANHFKQATDQGGWQPISTAPKDGTEVWLWLGAPWSRGEALRWGEEVGGWLPRDVAPEDAEGMCGELVPTMWQPMPAAPTPLGVADGDAA